MRERIRVLLVTTGFYVEGPSGGIARFVIEFGRALDRKCFEPVICGLWYYGTTFEDERMASLRALGIEAFAATAWDEKASYWNVYRAFQGIREWLARHSVDIAHSHTEFGDLAVAIAGRQAKTPLLIRTLHNHEWRRRPLLRPFANLLYPLLYDIEVGVAPHVVQRLNRRIVAKALSRKALYISEAIDLARYRNRVVDAAEIRRQLGIPRGSKVVGSIGRLSQQKGYTYFIKAAQLILKRLPETYFVLVGTGELANELRGLVREIGIASRVIFTGPRSDVEDLIQCMDLFVSSSLWEGMPIVILESMAAGVPVIATDIPGTGELIHDGVNGRLVRPFDAKALAQAVLELLQEPRLGSEFAERAQATAENYSVGSVATTYQYEYCAALHGRLVHKRNR